MRLLNASGCLDALAAPEVARTLDVFVTKTVTPLPREGNAPVRIAEVEVGMLNAIGLANPGVEAFVAEHLPRLSALGVPCRLGSRGLEKIIEIKLTPEEDAAFKKSAAAVKELVGVIGV